MLKGSLGALRAQTKTKQLIVATHLQMQESAISKIERKSIEDIKLSRLQKYVEALGGKLVIQVEMPGSD
jgi:transcriptional regulator